MEKLVALDIETCCAKDGCVETSCGHALLPQFNRITVVGAWWKDSEGKPQSAVFRKLKELSEFLEGVAGQGYKLLGHGFKFDLRTLRFHGVNIPDSMWGDDSHLMAATYTRKIPDSYLAEYEARRRELNKELPVGKRHRDAGKHSLKTLAPYFLGVDAFWESTLDHDNDEYVLLDCEYTYRLAEFMRGKLIEENSLEFYRDQLLPLTKLLVEMEMDGIQLDWGALRQAEQEAAQKAAEAKRKLDLAWSEAYKEHWVRENTKLFASYQAMSDKARLKAKTPEAAAKVEARYTELYSRAAAKIEGFNIDSPSQLAWLFKEYFKLDIENFDGEESTGKEVLERLAADREDIKLFLEYRKQTKLSTAFFPTYKELAHNGRIHCFFNATGTRTGRLSSSSPNLQQVPGHLHKLFCAEPGYSLITRDMSGIEPVVIAYYSQDPILCRILINGSNFHSYNTKVIFSLDCAEEEVKKLYPKERDLIKENGLSILYGAGWRRVQASAQKRGFKFSKTRCQEIVEMVRTEYSGVWEFKQQLDIELRDNAVTNLLGRPFRIENEEEIYMKGFNTLVQGSASDLVWTSAKRIKDTFATLGIRGGPRLLVHDEIVIQAENDRLKLAEEAAEACMTDYVLETEHGRLPLKVEGGTAPYWSKG